MNRWLLAGVALLMGAGLGLRAPRLTLRPFHNDEGVGAMNFRHLYVEHDYKYNPDEFHGPTLAYSTLPAVWLQRGGEFNDFTEATYRSVTVAFGLALIFVLLLLTPGFGRAQILWAAAFTALSPAMVFYSRYYIHEMLLAFFAAWTFICFWRFANSGRIGWLVAGGVGLGLMYATKETFVFAVTAMVLSVATSAWWAKWRGSGAPVFQPHGKWHPLVIGLAAAVAALAAAVTAVVFFSSFFTNAAGPLDALRTYLVWFGRAGGATEHVHPWYFYFERLLFFHVHGGPYWSEGFIVALALVGFCAALRGGNLLLRLIAFYTFWLTLIYTVLPYKTPWCLLGFYHGMILLAATGVMMIWGACRPGWLKAVVAILLTAGVSHLAWQSYRGNFAVDSKGVPYCDSAKNPYVYSQTLPDALRLVATVEALTHASLQGNATMMEVMSPESYWPLPWYLRRFSRVGYWDKVPSQPPAQIMIVSTSLHAAFDEAPAKTHLMAGYFELRPQVFLELYVETNLWAAYVKTLPPEKE